MTAPWDPSAELRSWVATEPRLLDTGTQDPDYRGLGPSYQRSSGLLPHSSSQELGLSIPYRGQSSQCMQSFTCKFLITDVLL